MAQCRSAVAPVKYVADPDRYPVLLDVARVWHFPTDDVLLDLVDRCNCLVPGIGHVEVPARGIRQDEDIVIVETATNAHVVTGAGERVLRVFDVTVTLG